MRRRRPWTFSRELRSSWRSPDGVKPGQTSVRPRPDPGQRFHANYTVAGERWTTGSTGARSRLRAMLGCRPPHTAAPNKGFKRPRLVTPGPLLYGRGREVHAWQTPPGAVAKTLPSKIRMAGGNAGLFLYRIQLRTSQGEAAIGDPG